MAKTGRPTRDPNGEVSKFLPIRTTEAEREAYKASARTAGLSLSQWVREHLNEALRQEAKRG